MYTNEMGKYQVINLTWKSAKQRSFESAYAKIKEEIAEEFNRHKAILDEYDVPLENAYFKVFMSRWLILYVPFLNQYLKRMGICRWR